jgi:hypothetical protein
MKQGLLFIFLVFSVFVRAQLFSGAIGPIKSDSTLTNFSITISGVGTLKSTIGLKKVGISILHPAVQELHIYLRSPGGASIALSVNNGMGANYINTVFDNTAAVSIRNATAPFTGAYKPENSLAVLNSNNIMGDGIWTLIILDDQKNNNNGDVTAVSLEFGSNPPMPSVFRQSNLPVFVVNTSGVNIPTLNDINSRMYILNNSHGVNILADTSNMVPFKIGIHIRGNSSASGLKDPYSFSPVDIHGNDSDMSILGMPAENDWILNNAYGDQSFMRDPLSYYLYNRLGWYVSRTRFCELVINGDYRGVYCLMEKIKHDKNRVDISSLKPTDTAGTDVTGGYIIKKDGGPGVKDSGFMNTASGFYYLYHDPDSPVIQQKQYIKAFMDTAVSALLNISAIDTLHGYRHYVDYKSAIDYIIICELGVSGDTYSRSTYWYKQKITKGNKLYFGPVWDFNYGWISPSQGFKFPSFTPWKKMWDDNFFRKEMWCRYNEVRAGLLSPSNINYVIDSLTDPLYEAMYRNDERWQQNKNLSGLIQNCYYKDANYCLKKYSYERLHFMDSFFRASCNNVRSVCPPILNYSLDKDSLCTGDSAILVLNTTAAGSSFLAMPGIRKINNFKYILQPSVTTTFKIFGNSCFLTDTLSIRIAVGQSAILSCTGKDTIIQGDSILLVVKGAQSYYWSGTVNPLNSNMDSVYVKPKATTIFTAFSGSTQGCVNWVSKKIIVLSNLYLSILASKDTLCPGSQLSLIPSGAITYKWNINGTIYNTDTLVIHPSTDLNIKLYGYSGIYSDSVLRSVKTLPKPLFTLPASITVCTGDSVQLDLNTSNSYTWVPSNYVSFLNNTASVKLKPLQTQAYKVYAVNNYGCIDSGSILVVVKTGPGLVLSPGDSICEGEYRDLSASSNGSVLWVLDSSTMSLGANSIRVFPHQSHTYYAFSTFNGCSVYDSVVIKVRPKPRLKINAPIGICNNDSATIICEGADSYFISPVNGVSKISSSVFKCSLSSPTTYSIIGWINQCSDTEKVTINIFQSTNLQMIPNTASYYGTNPVMLRAVGGISYSWTPTQGLDRYDNDTVYASPASTTLYTVNAIDFNNCATSNTVLVTTRVGINNNSNTGTLNIYPNPAKNELTINNQSEMNYTLMLYNSVAQLVKKESINSGITLLPLEGLASGIYLLQIGEKTFKIVKE